MTANLAPRFNAVKQQIAQSANLCGRNPALIQLIAVSKSQQPSGIHALYQLGQRAFGENYIQEALEKMAVLPNDIEWHCIGPIQSNKSRLVAENFAWCHTVASLRLAKRLNEQRPVDLPPLNICLQLHLGAEASKSGASAHEILDLARACQSLPRLRLRGLMCIPPPEEAFDAQRAWFRQAAAVQQSLLDAQLPVDTLSMGMSGDLRAAIFEHSTMVRIGTALFGPRSPKACSKVAPHDG